jgi:hypothetical protein
MPGLLSKSRVAELFGVSAKTLDRDVRRGLLAPPCRIKGRSYWEREYVKRVLADWVAQGRALTAEAGLQGVDRFAEKVRRALAPKDTEAIGHDP